MSYIAMFLASLLLAGAAYWDYAQNAGRLQVALVSAFLVLLAVGVLLLAQTALEREEDQSRPASAVLASLLQVAAAPTRVEVPRPAGPPASPAPSPGPKAAATPVPRVLVRGAARPPPGAEGAPARIPGPESPPPPASERRERLLSYESGVPRSSARLSDRLPRGAPGGARPTRVLCGACGCHFPLFVEASRPQPVPCPRCTAPLVIEGAAKFEPHVAHRCRACGAFGRLPRRPHVTAFQCGTCGQINDLRQPRPMEAPNPAGAAGKPY